MIFSSERDQERLERARFWVISPDGVYRFFPGSAPAASTSNGEKIVVIKGLRQGQYTIQFTLPNQDGLFEKSDPVAAVVKGNETTQVRHLFKALKGKSPVPEYKITTLPMDSSSAAPSSEPPRFFTAPVEQGGFLTIESNVTSAEWTIVKNGKKVVSGRGSASNLKLEEGSGYILKPNEPEGYRLAGRPGRSFVIKDAKTTKIALLYKRTYGQVQVKAGERFERTLSPTVDGEPMEGPLAFFDEKGESFALWKKSRLSPGLHQVKLMPGSGQDIPVAIKEGEETLIDYQQSVKYLLKVLSNTKESRYSLKNEQTAEEYPGEGESYTFEGLSQGNYILSFQSLKPEKTIPPMNRRITIGPGHELSEIRAEYKLLRELLIQSNVSRFHVAVLRKGQSVPVLSIDVPGREKTVFLEEGLYTLEFSTQNPSGEEVVRQVDLRATDQTVTVNLQSQEPLPEQDVAKRDEDRAGLGLIDVIETTLRNNLDILLSYAVSEDLYGRYRSETGVFDTNMRFGQIRDREISFDPLETSIKPVDAYSSTTSLSLEKKFITGAVVRPEFFIERVHDNFLNKLNPTTSSLMLNMKIPLLKNAGIIPNTAGEWAAKMTYFASLHDARFRISRVISDTAKLYYRLTALMMERDILIETVAEAADLVEKVQRLAELKEFGEAEIYQPKANLKEKKEQLLRVEVEIINARAELLVAMGLFAGCCPPAFMEGFLPDLSSSSSNLCCDALIKTALTFREDLKARLYLRKANYLLFEKAKNGIYPEVDLEMAAGWAGMDKGGGLSPYFQSVKRNAEGTNWTLGISVAYPFGNNEAEGQLIQNRAQLQRSEIEIAKVQLDIQERVPAFSDDLSKEIKRKKEIDQEIDYYIQAVEAEMRKLEEGLTTVIDVIQLQDKLLQSRIVGARQSFDLIAAFIDLKFSLGLILPYSNTPECCRIDEATFFTLGTGQN